jgi:hypothetical protein
MRIAAFIAVVGVALAIVGYASIRMLTVHDQPRFWRQDGSTLRIMDAEGKELWSKVFPEGFWTNWYYPQGPVWIGDLEGKGHTSVLFRLNRALFQFNMAIELTVEHGIVRFTVMECIAPPGCRFGPARGPVGAGGPL